MTTFAIDFQRAKEDVGGVRGRRGGGRGKASERHARRREGPTGTKCMKVKFHLYTPKAFECRRLLSERLLGESMIFP